MRLAAAIIPLHACNRMTTPTQIRTWLVETLQREGLSVDEWAKRAGVAKSTIFRALKPDYEFVTSSRTLAKLADAVGAEPPASITNVKLAPSFLPVRYRVQAGLWYEVDAEEPPEQLALAVLPDPRFAAFPQWLEKVVGDSVDLRIPGGHYVHVIDAQEMGYAPRHGDWVVVERRRDQGAVRERTIKQVDAKNGHIQLVPRSRNPKWSEPVDYEAGAREGEAVEVVIVGLVVSAIDPNF